MDSINRHVFWQAKKAPIYSTTYAGRYIARNIVRLVLILVFLNFPLFAAETDKDKISKMHKSLNGSCTYSMLEKYQKDKEMQCLVNSLKLRCNAIDDCYTYCLSKNIGKNVGGGCAHLCN
ncbi:MAG: hypothetical protein GY931_20150 [Maribacter sp.]|nr:hypothetical protein [Maribacter sp.]